MTADHLRPALALQQRGDGAVDAAGHGDRDARSGAGCRGEAPPRRRGAGERPVQGVGGELRRVALGRASARRSPRRRRRRRSPPPPAPQRRRPSRRRRRWRPRVAPQPSASKLTDAIRSSSTTSEIRERSPQAAPPAAPVKASVSGRPAPALVAQIVLEQLPLHMHRVGGPPRPRRAAANPSLSKTRGRCAKRGSNPPLPPLALIPSSEGGGLLPTPRGLKTFGSRAVCVGSNGETALARARASAQP